MQRIRKYIDQRRAANLSDLICRQNELRAALDGIDYDLNSDIYEEIEYDTDRLEIKIQALAQKLYGEGYNY